MSVGFIRDHTQLLSELWRHLICRSRNAVVMSIEEDTVLEQKNETTKQNNGLAVTITISPPTPVPGHRCIVDASGEAADEAVEGSQESYEVIELNDEEAIADTFDAAEGQPESSSTAEKDEEGSDSAKPAANEGPCSSSQETTTVVTSTTTISKIITETEIITVNELNEEVIVLFLF